LQPRQTRPSAHRGRSTTGLVWVLQAWPQNVSVPNRHPRPQPWQMLLEKAANGSFCGGHEPRRSATRGTFLPSTVPGPTHPAVVVRQIAGAWSPERRHARLQRATLGRVVCRPNGDEQVV
jgi:hypothetical protein